MGNGLRTTDHGPRTTDHGRTMIRGRATAFTLTEILVVIGIIVLIAVIAVPSFRALTGGRSTEAAQNTISAVLSRARTEALGLQEPRGVMFYRDQETQRVGMMMCKTTDIFPGEVSGATFGLDLVGDRDAVLLPPGVGVQFVGDVEETPSERAEDRYLGFNTLLTWDQPAPPEHLQLRVPVGGVILFDGKGRLMSETYAFRFRYPAGSLGDPIIRTSELGRFVRDEPDMAAGPAAPTRPTLVDHEPYPTSKLGFVLFDEEEFSETFGGGRGDGMTADQDFQHDVRIGTFGPSIPPNSPDDVIVSNPPTEAEEEHWLNRFAVPILVNRYNGTLIRGQ
jgi:type II secretory pathway pseudopilin PulG